MNDANIGSNNGGINLPSPPSEGSGSGGSTPSDLGTLTDPERISYYLDKASAERRAAQELYDNHVQPLARYSDSLERYYSNLGSGNSE